MARNLSLTACLVLVFVYQMADADSIMLIPALPLLACCVSFQTVTTSGGDAIKSR